MGDDGWLTRGGQLLSAARRQLHEQQALLLHYKQQQQQQQPQQRKQDAAVKGLSLVGTLPSSDATTYSSTGDAAGSAFTSGSVGSASAGIMGSDAAAAGAAAGGEGGAGPGAEELAVPATVLHLGDPEASASAAVRMRQVWVSNSAWGCGQLAKLLVLTHNKDQLGLEAPSVPSPDSSSSDGVSGGLGDDGANASNSSSSGGGGGGGGGGLGLAPGLGVAAGRYANSPPRLVRLGVQAVEGGGTGAPGEAFVGQAVTVGGGVEDPDGDGLDLRLVWYGVPPRWVMVVAMMPVVEYRMSCTALIWACGTACCPGGRESTVFRVRCG